MQKNTTFLSGVFDKKFSFNMLNLFEGSLEIPYLTSKVVKPLIQLLTFKIASLQCLCPRL